MRYNKFYAMRSIREYRSNIADTYQAGIKGYRRLKKLLRHSKQDGHVEQIVNRAMGKANA